MVAHRAVMVLLGAGLWVALLGSAEPLEAQELADPEARLAELGLTLPPSPEPVANYVRAVRAGDLLFLAGHVECTEPRTTGKVGRAVSVDSAYASARRVGLCLLSTLKAELGDLRRVRRVVRLLGMVNATPGFTLHPAVINGASDLLVEVFGERGRHARSSVGVASLPRDVSVEIELVVEVVDDPLITPAPTGLPRREDMDGDVYTLGVWRVRPGHESEFIVAWVELGEVFRALPAPPGTGTLLRSESDPGLFYSFGPWGRLADIQAMRQDPQAQEAIRRLVELCVEAQPGTFRAVATVPG